MYSWGSTSSMVADVQAWVDNSSSNFGWALVGSESTLGSAKRFNSRENPSLTSRPRLTIDFTPPSSVPTVFINELHYDNVGDDSGEFVEVAAAAGTDLSGWSVALYNGASSSLAVYDTISLTGTVPDQCNGFGTVAFARAGIQNGSPDGLALVDPSGGAVQFLSYEGSFTAAGGPAAGETSVDIGVAETGSTPAGFSLYLTGTGTSVGDFSWTRPNAATFGLPNTGQGFDGVLCEAPPTTDFIHEVQSAGPNVNPGNFSVEAIVVGDFQRSDRLSGFFLQEEDADVDSDPATSEGIFVFCSSCPVDVAVGDRVRVSGPSSDFFGMSQLTVTTVDAVSILGSGNALPSPTSLTLPVPGVPTTDLSAAVTAINAYYEAFEGMLVTVPETLSVAEYFQLYRFGQVVLSQGGRPRQFTDESAPDASGLAQHQIDVARRRVILDDDDNRQNSALTDATPVFHPAPGFSVSNFIRGGYTLGDLTGVLHWSFAGAGGTDAWRIRPVTEAFGYAFVADNPRTPAPESVGGTLKVASFNVLNYFTTLNAPGNTCGPSALDCRGAHSASELARQTDKIAAALCDIDADIVGVIEIENDATAALSALVSAVNASCGGAYDFVNTGATGTDAIKVGLIYETGSADVVGAPAVLDAPSFTDPRGSGGQLNRPAVAQTFLDLGSGEMLTVVVNHLKSKGSGCGVGDDDLTTGQGNCNGTRTDGASALAAWLGADPTGSGAEDVLIIGDLNAYRREDPLQALAAAGYADLLDTFVGVDAYSYIFDGQAGYLDHALANDVLLPKVTGVTEWHINADEVDLLDYNDTIQDANEQSFEAKPTATPLYAPDAYRSSDHDPIVVGIDLRPEGGVLVVRPRFNGLAVRWMNVDGTSGEEVLRGLNGRSFIGGQLIKLSTVGGDFLVNRMDGIGIRGPGCPDAPETQVVNAHRINCREKLRLQLDPGLTSEIVTARIGFRVTDGQSALARIRVYRDGLPVGRKRLSLAGGETRKTFDFGVPFDTIRIDALAGAFSVTKARFETAP